TRTPTAPPAEVQPTDRTTRKAETFSAPIIRQSASTPTAHRSQSSRLPPPAVSTWPARPTRSSGPATAPSYSDRAEYSVVDRIYSIVGHDSSRCSRYRRL